MSAADNIAAARADLWEGIAATIRLWDQGRQHVKGPIERIDVDNEAFDALTSLQLVLREMDSAIESELQTPDDPIANVERITRNGGRDA